MDLTTLRFLYTVAREGSFMAAAQKLDYAQSNLSTRIRQLEESLGEELLIRGRGGVVMTEKGRILYDYAEKILALSAEAESSVKGDLYASSELTVSAMESAAVTFLPAILSAYHEKRPNTAVRVRTGTSDAGVRAVLDREADAAIVVGRNNHEELVSIPFRQEKLVIVTDAVSAGSMELSQLLRRELLVFPTGCAYRRVLERWLTDEGIAAARLMEFTSLGAILASVSAGLGVCLFPESAIRSFAAGDFLRCVEIPEKYRMADIHLVTRRRSEANRTLTDFIDTVTQVGRQTYVSND